MTDQNRQPTLLSADTLEGNCVKNLQGEDIGTIVDMMLDVERGKIAYAVLSFGGLLGFGDKLFAVPWRALQLDTSEKCFRLDASKERLDESDGFDKDNWPDMADIDWSQRTHQRFGQQPYWN